MLAAWTVMLRGIRYRAGRSLVVFLLAALATTAAVLAPAYSRAAQQSVLADGVREEASLIIGAGAGAQPIDEIRLATNQVLARQPTLAGRLDAPIGAVDTPSGIGVARLAFREHVCDHLDIKGTCPAQPGQLVLSKGFAAAQHLGPGSRLTIRNKGFTVTGLYTPKDPHDGYWGSTVYTDALFTTSEDDLRTEKPSALNTRLEYPVARDRIRLDDVPALRDGIKLLGDRLRGDELEVTTTLPDTLDGVDADQGAIARTAPVIAVPLVLLCFFVLFLLVASLTEERSAEIALAKLRGYPTGRAARFGLGEVLLLIAVATPVGLVAGLLLVQLAAGALLATGTNVEIRWPVFAAAGIALAAGVVAALLAGRHTLAQPVLDLLRRVPERTGWRAGLVEGAVVALAGAAIAAALSDRASPLALLAAPMLAVVAGIGAARLLGLWSKARLRLARRRGRLVPLLASAQLSRRPGGQRVVVVVTIAVALLSFAATAWDVAAQARHDTAEDQLGAERVLSVTADHPGALSTAVAKADPAGHSMAVVRTTQRYGDEPIQLLGVQAARLPAVAVWRGRSRDDLGRLAGMLHPATAAPLALGRQLSVTAIGDALPERPQLRLAAVISTPGQPPRSVDLGVLARGAHQLSAALPGCVADCHLVGLSIGRASGGTEPFTARLSIRDLHTEAGPLAAGFDQVDRWKVRGGTQAHATVRAGTPLALDVSSSDPSDVIVDYVDTPDRLPTVLAGPAPADDPHATSFTFPGFAEQPQPFTVAAQTASLPRAGDRGLLFDLDDAVRMAERTSSLSDNTALRYEVWAGPGAPADLDRRLAAEGVQVLRVETMGGYLDQLGRRAPALGLWLYLLAGASALLLAVGVVLLTAYVGVQGRLYELAALRVAGVRRSVLRRSVFREYRALLGLPFVVGLAAGVLGALVMLPGIPLVTVGRPTGSFTYRPGVGALPVAIAASLIGLLLAVVLVLRMLRRATPDRLRDGDGA
jgi:putative ABC transport system permease protein